MTSLYWWRDQPNFGDAMSPWIVERVLGKSVCWAPPQASPKLVGLGSVLWAAKSGDTVWGTGLHPFSHRWAPRWSARGIAFLAVRGPLTREFILRRGGDCPERYGDPGELLPYFFSPPQEKRAKRGLLAHIFDEDGRRFAAQQPATLPIDPRDPWERVVAQIVSCEMIWSSSLHGIIVAEAYGIPAVWVSCGEGAQKYRDYYSATDRGDTQPVGWGDAATARPLVPPPRARRADHPLTLAIRQLLHGGAEEFGSSGLNRAE